MSQSLQTEYASDVPNYLTTDKKRSKGGIEYQLLDEPGVDTWSTWTVPMSMREVEPGVGLVMSDDTSHFDPEWRAQKKKPRQEDNE